jgi:two-component system, response regulator YesN
MAGLTDLITHEQFEHIEKTFRRHYKLGLETINADGQVVRSMCSGDCFGSFCKTVRSSKVAAKRCKQDHLKSLKLAFETGQPYMSFCHAGIILISAPIMDRDTPLGGVLFGKCLWKKPDELFVEDLKKQLKGLRLDFDKLLKEANRLPVLSGKKIQEAAEFLFVLLYEVFDLDPRIIEWRQQITKQQSMISEVIQKSKKIGSDRPYPFESERALIGKVKIGDKIGAKEMLNSYLGSIMFLDPGDINVLKARMVELLSFLSRAAVEGGMDINLMLKKNLGYINKVIDLDSQEQLCAWISEALNDFIESVYSSQDSKKMTKVQPAIDFIEANYTCQFSLQEVAKAAHLSVSRLAHLFKEQIGITIIDYLTDVRINHAKKLLLSSDKNCTEICFEVGYNNQSYFIRAFRGSVGMTPLQFRQNNKRPLAN